jgi:hypothetical protein
MIGNNRNRSSGTKNNNNEFSHEDREVRQELYLSHQYEKARQDVWAFLLRKICIM